MKIHGTTQTPLLPRHLASFVLSILGLSDYPTFASDAVHVPALASKDSASTVQTGTLTPADFAKQYNLDPLYQDGATGAGSTIGIVTLASVDPSDPEYFWSDVLGISTLPNRISLVNVAGGSGPVSAALGSDETTLDVEQSGGLAPQAKIIVYQAPNTDYGFVDGFYDAASQNIVDTLSSSWGESETAIEAAVNTGTESPNYAISFDDAFLELAAQGQSSFVSAGDYGAYTAVEDQGSANLSVGNPDSSPWVTSAGGTTLAGTIPISTTVSATISAQRTWGWDWLWPYYSLFNCGSSACTSEAAFAETAPVGGGGGFSVYEPTPEYQWFVPSVHHFSAVEYLTPTDYVTEDGLNLPTAWNFNADPSVTSGWGTGRATPDVSADADPFTGYLLYCSCYAPGETLEAGWGGTSFVAPQLNGSTAVIDSLLGKRVGFWNPAIYQFAAWQHSPFAPLSTAGTDNDNLYYTGTPGQIYNVGSGLGTPNLARLAADFAS
jgi:subtilase family serine protease